MENVFFAYVEPCITIMAGIACFIVPETFWKLASPISPSESFNSYSIQTYGVVLILFGVFLYLVFARYYNFLPKRFTKDVLTIAALGDVLHVTTWLPYYNLPNVNVPSLLGNVGLSIILFLARLKSIWY